MGPIRLVGKTQPGTDSFGLVATNRPLGVTVARPRRRFAGAHQLNAIVGGSAVRYIGLLRTLALRACVTSPWIEGESADQAALHAGGFGMDGL